MPGQAELPREEPAAGEAEAKLAPEALARFQLDGRDGAEPLALTPALCHAYGDAESLRHDYPLLAAPGLHASAVPLTDLFDDLGGQVVEDGENREPQRRQLLKLESQLRKRSGAKRRHLADNWEAAIKPLVSENGNTQWSALAQRVREHLPADGELIPCDHETPRRLLAAAAIAVAAERRAALDRDIDELRLGLDDILEADASRSKEALSPERLRTSTADDGVNYEALAAVANRIPSSPALPEDRRQRIVRARDGFADARRQLSPDGDDNASVPTGAAAEAVDQAKAARRVATACGKAARVAYLEVNGDYRPEVHDAYFERFTDAHLSADERARCPLTIVEIPEAKLDWSLLEALATGLPIKLLVRVADAVHASSTAGALAAAAIAAGDVYVLHTTNAAAESLVAGLDAGLRYPGPALFIVHTGPYLQTAAALESRAFPSFINDPAAGDGLADRFTLAGTPQPEQRWSTDGFAYETDDGDVTLALPFTYADFLAMAEGQAGGFLPVAKASWTDRMIALDDYLALGPEAPADALPYILMVDPEGRVQRVLVAREAVDATRRCAARWRRLQELAGINNSHAARALAAEQGRIDEARRREVEALQAQHEKELNRTVQDLAEVVIDRIAAGLLDTSAAARSVSPVPAATAPSEPAAAAEPEPAAATATEVDDVEEEEEILALDDPYIETVRCTTCNECTNRNGLAFAYNAGKQAYIKDASAATYRQLVEAAEVCPVHIIHPGKPMNPDEPGLEDLIKRAEKFR